MAYEMLVGLHVTDAATYAAYRAAMAPLLESLGGGGFRYDFEVAKTLKSEAAHEINRVFCIYFGSKEQKERFFAHPDYLKAKERFFAKAVAGTTVMAEYTLGP